jgi:hypothetical protein
VLDERLTGTQALGGAIVVLAVAGLLVAPRRRGEPESSPP